VQISHSRSKKPLPPFISDACASFRKVESKINKTRGWRPVKLAETKPFMVMMFGDIHGDDPACNWPQLVRDIEICRNDGVYGVHLGDVTNNWVGRLTRLFAKHNVSQDEARRRVRWLLHDAGVHWLWWLVGNHDEWNEGGTILDLLAEMAPRPVIMADWEGTFDIQAAGQSWKVHAAHNFKGNSEWNILHGPTKAARRTSLADLYVCGHLHNWGTGSFEIPGHNRVVHMLRARGYKWDDSHAIVNGFEQTVSGAAIACIFNPAATTAAGRILTFEDPQTALAVLQALRNPPAKRKAAKKPGSAAKSRALPSGRRRGRK
jgi:hypothetical protein